MPFGQCDFNKMRKIIQDGAENADVRLPKKSQKKSPLKPQETQGYELRSANAKTKYWKITTKTTTTATTFQNNSSYTVLRVYGVDRALVLWYRNDCWDFIQLMKTSELGRGSTRGFSDSLYKQQRSETGSWFRSGSAV